MTTRHEFLAQLHDLLQPRGYLEVGVQYGTSLALAKCPAIGIDPAPHVGREIPNAQIFTKTSDEFFSDPGLMEWWGVPVDLAFIDGMHLYEYALRDFENIEKYTNPRTVIVFDDVLPRNQHEAAREQCPGDWTGDVWKTARLIQNFRRDLKSYLVDTQPTGTFVVYGFLQRPWDVIPSTWQMIQAMGLEAWEQVPDDVISRAGAISAQDALEHISTYLEEL